MHFYCYTHDEAFGWHWSWPNKCKMRNTKNYYPMVVNKEKREINPISWKQVRNLNQFFFILFLSSIWNLPILCRTGPRRHGVSNHHQPNCLFDILFRLTVKKTSKLCIIGPLWVPEMWISFQCYGIIMAMEIPSIAHQDCSSKLSAVVFGSSSVHLNEATAVNCWHNILITLSTNKQITDT